MAYGFVKEYHGTLMRDAKITQIYEGTSVSSAPSSAVPSCRIDGSKGHRLVARVPHGSQALEPSHHLVEAISIDVSHFQAVRTNRP